MPDFPKSDEGRTHWSVWRGNNWLGEWHGRGPRVGDKIKPKECLTSKKVDMIDRKTGRVYVK